MGDCLTEEQLRDLALESLSGEEAAPLLVHACSCASCGESLTEWRQNAPFMTLLRHTLVGEHRPPPTSPSPSPGLEAIEGYQIVQEIHRGAQGIVYRALDQITSATVAIKIVGAGAFVSEVSRRRFEREIDLVANLHHPGIIRVHRSGATQSGRQYFVMDHVAGLPLHRYVWQKGLSIDEALTLFVRVCDAVNFAHQRGVIHCDLKPSNILVGEDGTPNILDFGLARCTFPHGDERLSVTGQIMGTLPYMSPEQTRADRSEVDIRTDVYALGVMLYEILTGRYPYPVTGSVPDVFRHINDTAPALPSKIWTPDTGVTLKPGGRRIRLRRHRACPIDDAVDTIVLKALAKEPHRRYANVAMLMEDLSRHLHGQPIEARREAWMHSFRKQISRYKTAVVLAMICAVLTAGSALKYWHTSLALKAQQTTMLTYQSRLAAALMLLGDRALEQTDWEESSGYYRAAMFIIRDLVAGDPHNLEYLSYQADVFLRLGNLFRGRNEFEAAAAHYAKALELANHLVSADPARPALHLKLAQIQGLCDELKSSTGWQVTPSSRPSPASEPRRQP